LAKGPVRAAKHEQREIAAKSPERGLGVAKDTLGHTEYCRPGLEESLCSEAQPVADEDRADEELLYGSDAGLMLPI
jgi:hypothetical protein